MKNVEVRTEIARSNAEVCKKLEITKERVLKELACIAFLDPRAIWNEDGSAKAICELDEDTARAIAGFEVAELFEGNGNDRSLAGYVKKFKLADTLGALEIIGRHLQMFPTKVDASVDVTLSLGQRLAAARKRLGEPIHITG